MEKKRNLWVIPTDKPSRLVKIYNDVNRETFTLKLNVEVNDSFKEYVNVYVTSDEEIISLSEINSLPLSDGKDIQTNMSNI